MTLSLNDLTVACVIGERPDERERTQILHVDVEIEIPSSAAETDDLRDTVDYAALSEKIRRVLIEAKCQMIERAACLVYEVCVAETNAQSVHVTVTKPGAIPHLASASVSYP